VEGISPPTQLARVGGIKTSVDEGVSLDLVPILTLTPVSKLSPKLYHLLNCILVFILQNYKTTSDPYTASRSRGIKKQIIAEVFFTILALYLTHDRRIGFLSQFYESLLSRNVFAQKLQKNKTKLWYHGNRSTDKRSTAKRSTDKRSKFGFNQ
jgi:hypothetical protein